MALGSIQPLKEMSNRNISWGGKRPVRRADNLNHPQVPIISKSGSLPFWNPQGLPRSVQGLLYLHLTVLKKVERYGSRSKQPNMLPATCYRISRYGVRGGGREREREREEEEAGVTDNRQLLNYLNPPQLEDIQSDQK
jgi:hypothetical protein